MGTNASVAAEARAALARANMTQTDLAAASGRSRPYWQKRLTGAVSLSIDDLSAVAEATGTPVTDLMRGAA